MERNIWRNSSNDGIICEMLPIRKSFVTGGEIVNFDKYKKNVGNKMRKIHI